MGAGPDRTLSVKGSGGLSQLSVNTATALKTTVFWNRGVHRMSTQTVHFVTEGRLLSDVLAGYSSTYVALLELINNAIQAKASEIQVHIEAFDDDTVSPIPLRSIRVRDNGIGVHDNEFVEKIIKVGTDSKTHGKGIGRFAAFQIGKSISIETVGQETHTNRKTLCQVALDASQLSGVSTEDYPIVLHTDPVEETTRTYYEITINDLYSADDIDSKPKRKIVGKLLPENLPKALFLDYSTEMLESGIRFLVNGALINPDDYLVESKHRLSFQFPDIDGILREGTIEVLHFQDTKKHITLAVRTTASGVKVTRHSENLRIDIPDDNGWMFYVDSPVLGEGHDLYRNINMTELDTEASSLLEASRKAVRDYLHEKFRDYFDFTGALQQDEYYPLRKGTDTPNSKRLAFNRIAYFIELEHNILRRQNTLRRIIYPLVNLAIDNGDLQEILAEVITLSDQQVHQFRRILRDVELSNVIEFSASIVRKSQFLDFLEKLVYSEISSFVKERKELHKIVERELWLFGEKYTDTPILFSDKSLKNNLITLRDEYLQYEPLPNDDNVLEVDDELRDITDLFFFNEKLLDDTDREIMIVELKSPQCAISHKELAQIDRYAYEIESRAVFSRELRYRLFLVSSRITDFGRSKLGQLDSRVPSLYYRSKKIDLEAHVLEWSDLIFRSRKRLSYLGKMLQVQDADVFEVIKRDYADIVLGDWSVPNQSTA